MSDRQIPDVLLGVGHRDEHGNVIRDYHMCGCKQLPSVEMLAEALHSSRIGHRSHALEECDDDPFYPAVVEARAARILDFLDATP